MSNPNSKPSPEQSKPRTGQPTALNLPVHAHPLLFTAIAGDNTQLAQQAETGANAAIAAASNIVLRLFKQTQDDTAKQPSVATAERLTTIAERLQALRDKAKTPINTGAKDITHDADVALSAIKKLARDKG
jgi:dihydrodipicolinate synthase/N-acetylneuraminate lyase